MKIQDILSLTPEQRNNMTNAELKKTLTAANRAANRRLKTLKEKRVKSAAYKNAMRGGGKFKNKQTRAAMQKELRRAMNFLQAKTSTVTGAKKVQREFEKRVGVKLSPRQTDKFWDTYEKLQEIAPPNAIKNYGSTRLQQIIADETKQGADVDDILGRVADELRAEYEKRETEYNEMGRFFEMDGQDF